MKFYDNTLHSHCHKNFKLYLSKPKISHFSPTVLFFSKPSAISKDSLAVPVLCSTMQIPWHDIQLSQLKSGDMEHDACASHDM